jgi:hypothetical protein
LNRFLALKVLWTDAGSAWDNVSWVLGANRLSSPVGIAIGSEALSFLHPSSWSARGTTWHIDGLNEHVQRDERWLDLLVSIRHDADIGRAARSALWHMDRSIVDPLLDAAAHHDADELAAEPHPPAVVPGALVRRYEAGDHDAVWRELRSVVRLDAAWRNEAHALAMATMERVRRNAERLVTALADAGWPLNRDTAISAPPNDLEARLATIESLTGSPCPPSAVAFWRVVGGIRLVPELEPWPPNIPYALAELDPLEVADPASVWFAVDEWQEGSASAHPELAGPIELPIAADHLHKANISGGPPYALWLPDNGADPIVREEPHRLPFTDYLRHVFRNSGFALLSERPDEEAQRWVASLDYVYEPF